MKNSEITDFFLLCAIQAESLMKAYCASALRTVPLFLFTLHKGFEAGNFNPLQVSHQAGPVFGTVPLIQLLHPLAGILTAFITEFRFSFCQVGAVQDHTIYPAG
jgi:hypothetical protein